MRASELPSDVIEPGGARGGPRARAASERADTTARAYRLARSGRCDGLVAILDRLRAQGIRDVAFLIDDRALAMELRWLCAASGVKSGEALPASNEVAPSSIAAPGTAAPRKGIEVFQFRVWDGIQGRFVVAALKGTRTRIERLGGRIVEGTGELVDRRTVDDKGRHRLDRPRRGRGG